MQESGPENSLVTEIKGVVVGCGGMWGVYTDGLVVTSWRVATNRMNALVGGKQW